MYFKVVKLFIWCYKRGFIVVKWYVIYWYYVRYGGSFNRMVKGIMLYEVGE